MWTGERTFVAGDDPLKCLQLNGDFSSEFPLVGSEDCLHLDVHVPMRGSVMDADPLVRAELPVLVWIHGGSFNVGWARQFWGGPDNFVKQVVTAKFHSKAYCNKVYLIILRTSLLLPSTIG